MSKSIKLKNDNYLDSSSVIHKKQKLSEILENGIEIITNNNGTAIKFANGIMLAYRNGLVTGNYDSGNYVSTVTWTYPIKFVDTPSCLASANGGNSLSYTVLVGLNSTTSATMQLKAQPANNASAYVNSSGRAICAFAIGRWK